MAKPLAITANLVDVRNIAAHKCVRLEIHVPVEQAGAVMEAFGWPTMVNPVAVAIARLDLSKASAPASNIAVPKEKRRFAELPIATQAALLCGREAFWRFLRENEYQVSVVDEYSAAAAVRAICNVASRSDLAKDSRAAGVFVELSLQFEAWLAEPI